MKCAIHFKIKLWFSQNYDTARNARFIQWRCIILGRGKQIKRTSLRTNFDKLVSACYSLEKKFILDDDRSWITLSKKMLPLAAIFETLGFLYKPA